MRLLPFINTVIMALILFFPHLAGAEGVFSGTLKGWNCISMGVGCAIDKGDPHLALEPDIVLVTDETSHYHLTNLPRSIKMKYFKDRVRVFGTAHPRYKAILVDKFQVKVEGRYKTIWDAEIERRKQEEEERIQEAH